MDYRLSDEQELLRESVQEWCERNITEEQIRQWYADHAVPDEIAKSWIEAGFGFMGIPEEYGGTPCDTLTLTLLTEWLSQYAGCALPFVGNVLLMYDMIHFGNPEQVKLAMDLYATTGRQAFSLALSEPGAGSDSMGMTTVARETPDGKIILSGSKTWVSNGESVPYHLVIAKDEDSSRENTNMSMWIFPADTPGVRTAPLEKIGQKTTPFCELYLDDVVLDRSALVGVRGKGFMQLMRNLEMERCIVTATGLGWAQAAMEDAAAYASQRIAFGKPIASYQLIQEKLTDMEIKLQTMRALLYKTAWELDNGIPVQITTALVKRYIGKCATEVCSEALQIFAGLGYTTETRVGRMWIDARGNEIAGGTDEIMVHIAGRQLAKKYKK